jgi:uncharacterized protein YndB with AHSA1/START domain
MSERDAILLTRDVHHPRARVWQALTDPAIVEKWWAKGDMRAQVGHTFTLDMGLFGQQRCTVLAAEPEGFFSYTFAEDVLGTTVTWRLDDHDDSTRLSLEHAGFELSTSMGRQAFEGMSAGWPPMLDKLQAALAELAREAAENDANDELEMLKPLIRQAFAATPPPEPLSMRGSDEGEEPFLLEEDFREVPDWRLLGTAFLDQSPDGFGSALSFFSPQAFRYYLPAYLLADLDEVLCQADPLFHLWHGLDDQKRHESVNELRYGGWTWFEAVSERLSGFTREEVTAIVAYLRYKAERDECARPRIEQALRNYWLPRAQQMHPPDNAGERSVSNEQHFPRSNGQ